MHGRAIQLVSGVAASNLEQDLVDRVEKRGEKSYTFGGLVRATAADVARIQFTDGVTTTSHAFHSGVDQWEWQEITVTPAATMDKVRAICLVAANGTAQFDHMYMLVSTSPLRSRYDIGTTMRDGPHALYVARSKTANPLYDGWEEWPYYAIDGASDPNSNNDSGPANSIGRYVQLSQLPSAGRRLRMVGTAPLTAAAADATSIEVDQPQVTRLAVRASVTFWKCS